MLTQEKSPNPSIEWPTLTMIVINYGLWVALLSVHQDHPLISTVMIGVCLAMHLSLQHEIIHGHPTRLTWLNDLLGTPPISLIYPYRVYKSSHLQHHRDELLTDPGEDPESFFFNPGDWERMGMISRALWWINMTLLGRLLINPIRSAVAMGILFIRQILGGTSSQRLLWTGHLLGVTAVLWLIHAVYSIPIWSYLLSVHIGHAFISLRSFYEHRIADEPMKRIVVVKSNPVFQLLFLNNNFHAVHHRYPGLPWYRLRGKFEAERDRILQMNGGFYFSGYAAWLQYLVRPVTSPVHPIGRLMPVS